MPAPHLFVAIPAMDELELLPLTLQDLRDQESAPPFDVFICVNQPDDYWQQPEKRAVCERNMQTLDLLRSETQDSKFTTQHQEGTELHVLDHASPGHGWQGRKRGVGWARKTLFDNILQQAKPDDLIVSLDADTRVPPDYLQIVTAAMTSHPEWPALSVPYYHPLTGEDTQDRAILRYELYMRNYALNLLCIGSPYGFTALGSAIVMRAGALRKIGGITPVQSGEDFYLLQKFCKMAPIGNYCDTTVFPSARLSDRVNFGTGPALIKGKRGDWESYPIYHHSLFESIAETYQSLPKLYREDVDTVFLVFLQEQFKESNLWNTIRQNVTDFRHFVLAFHQKADGLRILQYLRQKHRDNPIEDDEALYGNLRHWLPSSLPEWYSENTRMETLSVPQMNEIRDVLFNLENEYRRK
ncbi:MAG: hypothetical protein J5730_06715 [Bacteroidales bacterium]|nr:hypothetical protein [Bacteroidales bacterium]